MKVNVFFFYADTAFPNQSVYQKHCKGMAVKMRRTNRETSKWLKMISLKNLTMWANFEEAKTFFGSFPGDHKTFEKCHNEFENALSVSDHIRSAHHEELRKMFAKDARENLEEDSEYQIWLEAPTEINKNDATNLIKELESANEVLKRRLNEERRDTYKKVGERDGIIETEKVIYS